MLLVVWSRMSFDRRNAQVTMLVVILTQLKKVGKSNLCRQKEAQLEGKNHQN